MHEYYWECVLRSAYRKATEKRRGQMGSTYYKEAYIVYCKGDDGYRVNKAHQKAGQLTL